MRFLLSVIAVLALSQISDVFASDCVVDTSTPTFMNGKRVDSRCDENGRMKINATLSDTLAGEDIVSDVLKVEQRFAPINVSADTLVKSGPGQLHLMTCSSDATATAGSIILYDNTAESGTVLHTFTVAAAYYQPFTIWFDVAFSIGLYVGYTTTADVNCTVSYR